MVERLENAPLADRARAANLQAIISTKLGLGECEPFTRLRESHFSSAGQPLAFSLVDVDNSFITFQVFRRA